MKTSQNTRAVFDAFVHIRGECGFPWQELRAPGEDAGTDALGRKFGSEECVTAEDEEEGAVVEGVAAEYEKEDAAHDEGEDLGLGTLLLCCHRSVHSSQAHHAANDADERAIA
jgi:hypothetical protein